MAKSKAKLASTKPVSTKWLQNAMRSIGVSTKNVLKSDISPNLYEAVASGVNTSKSVIGSLKRNAGSANQINSQLKSNKYVKFAQSAYKNAISDLKSGNFNNEDRFADSLFGDSGSEDIDSLFDDSGFSFGDDGLDSVNVNIVNASNNNDAMFAMTTQLQKQTEATIKTSQANMNAMIAVNSASMAQMQQIGSLVVAGLDAINKNLSSLIEYNNSNMNRFIESSMAFYERMGTRFDKDDASSGKQKITANQVLNSSSGGINFGQYKQYIKQQFKDNLKGSNAGMIAGMIDDQMLQMASSNPLGFATEGLIKFMIPKMVTNTIRGVEETYSAFMPSLLYKLSKWGEGTADGLLGKAKQLIGKTFGLKMDRKDSISKSARIDKGPIPFDGQTKHAITEIITKELREQTSYLKSIAEHYKIDTAAAKKNAEVFDYRTGNYTTVNKITEGILTEIKDAIVGTFNSSTFGQKLRNVDVGEKHKGSWDHMLDELFVRLEKMGPDFKLDNDALSNKESDINKLISSLTGNKNLKKKITETIQEMVAKNPNAVLGLTPTVLRANAARNNAITDIENDPYTNNLYAATDFTGKDLDGLLEQYLKQQGKAKLTKGKVKGSPTSSTGEINAGNKDGTFSKLLSTTGQGLSNMALGFIHGSTDDVISNFTKTLSEQFNLLWNKFNEKVMLPLKHSLFGTKDKETGFSKDGIFSGVINGFKDAAGLIKHHITGKSFKDSKGNVHDAKENDTVIGNLKKIGSSIKAGVMEKLFGAEELDKDGNPTGKRKSSGILAGFTNSIKKGLAGWQEALFGKQETEKDKEKLKKSITEKVQETMPNAITGTAIGAGVGMMTGGGLLGTLVGGPIGGAIMGTVLGIASKSEKFQNWLFGKKDENGERTGGFISKKVQTFYKKNKNALVGGAAVGALTGSITGGGILGTLVGGPVAGALMGMSTAIIANSGTFKEFLFGNKKTGQTGVIQSLKKVFGSNKKDKGDKSDGSKALGMGILGAGAGALTAAVVGKMGILGASLTPFGPIGGALVGLGLSIRAQKDTFRKWLFGEKDEKGNKVKEGVLGRFGNMIKVSVLNPLKTGMSHFFDEAKFELKYNILDPIRFAVEPVATGLKNFASSIKEKVSGMFGDLKDAFKTNIIEKIDSLIITPLRSAISGITKVMWGVTKKVITAPFKLLDKGIQLVTNNVYKGIKDVTKAVTKSIFKIVTWPFRKIGKLVGNIAKFAITKPLNAIGGITSYIGDKINGVGKEDKVYDTKNQKDTERGRRAEQKKVDLFNMRKSHREDTIHDKNSRIIAKATNYQYTEDTEENRKRAEIILNKKIKWKVDAREDSKKKEDGATTVGMSEEDTRSANFKDLSAEGQQTNILLRIFDLLKGKFKKKDSDNINKPEENIEPEETPIDSTSSSNTDIDTGEESISLSEKIRRDIHDAGGLSKYFAGKFTGAREKVSNVFGATKSMVGDKVGKISGLLSRFKGKGHAEGTDDTGDEAAVVGENGPELVNFSKGNQVFANSKPLAVYIVGMAKSESSKKQDDYIDAEYEDITETPDDFGDDYETKLRQRGNGAFSSLVLRASSGDSEAASLLANAYPELADKYKAETPDDSGDATIDDVNGNQSAIDKGYTAAELAEKKEKDKQLELQEKTANGVTSLAETQKEHNASWASIFSKKGLFTGLAMLAIPLIIKLINKIKDSDLWNVIRGIGTAIGSILSGLANQFKWTQENGALGDGDTISDKVEENVDRTKGLVGKGNFILNEDGEWDHMSDANLKGVTKVANRATFKVARGTKHVLQGIDNMADTAANSLKSKVAYSADDVAKHFGTSADDVVKTFGDKAKYSMDDIAKSMGTSADDVAKMFANSGDDAAKLVADRAAKKAAKEGAEAGATKLASKGGSKLLKEVLEKIGSFADDFAGKVAKKTGKKVSTKIFAKVLKKFTDFTAKHFPKLTLKISGRIAAEGGIAASNAVMGLGTAIKVGMYTFGAINGVSGTARLFRVDQDHVDGWMKIIAGALGAFSGTLVGSIIDIINELFVSMTGMDILSEIATAVYGFLAGDAAAADLANAKTEFQDKYLEYQDKELTKQYETQKKAGLIDSEMSYEQFKEGVQSGEIKAKYDSFADFNDKEHQTIGSKIGVGLTKVGKSIKKAGKSVKSFFFGSTEKYLEDANGNRYYDNGDGTYQIKNADGEDLGFISKEALPEDVTENSEKKKGIFSKAGTKIAETGKAVGDFFSSGFTKIGDVFGKIKDTAVEAATGFAEGIKNIKDNWTSQDVSFKEYFTADVSGVSEDNPLSGIVKGVLNVGKVVMLPGMILGQVAKKIWKGIKAIGTGIKKIVTSVAPANDKIKRMALKGDITGLNNYKANFDESVPLSGFFETIVNVGKYTQYPLAGVAWVGRKIWEGIKALGTGIKTIVTSVGPEMNKVHGYAKAGDFESLNGYKANFDESVPLSGFFEGIVNIGKYTQYPLAGIAWVGRKIWEGIKGVGEGIKTVVTSVGPEMAKIQGYANNGDFESLNGYKANFDESVPLSGFFEGVLNIGKYVSYPLAGIKWIGNKIGEGFRSFGQNIGAAFVALKEDADEIDGYAENGDFSGLNSYKPSISDDVPFSGIVKAMLYIIKGFSYIKTAFNWIGEKIKGLFGGLMDTIGGAFDGIKSWLGGDGEGGSGKGVKALGGRGVPYYSQNDSQWADQAYGKDGSTMGDTGCGPTAMAMVTSGMTGKKVSPTAMAKLSESMGTRDSTGTNENFITVASSAFGLNNTQTYNPSTSNIYDAAANGPTILLGQNNGVGENPFTNAGHYVVADGVDENGNIIVKDPRGSSYNRKYSASQLASSTQSMWGFGGNGRRKRGGRSGNSLDMLSTISGFFSEFGDRAMSGLATGNYDSNFDSYFYGTEDSTSNSATPVISTDGVSSVNLEGNDNAEKIWKYYKSLGIPDKTIAGMLGNMRAESGLNPKNLQNSYESKLRYTDESYTSAIDEGRYSNFVHDSAGYGLVQWTYHSLKEALLNYAKSTNKSIGDLGMQLEFLYKQLSSSYPSTWKKMVSAATPEIASTIMLKEFEKPAVLNTETRANYAKQYYSLYGGSGDKRDATIKSRNIKNNAYKDHGGYGPTIDSINNIPKSSTVDYNIANNASNYIDRAGNSGITKAINMIIKLLEAITGNTASASKKLELLENIKGAKVNVGGNTTNYVTNNNSSNNGGSNNILTSGSGEKKASRNQKIAEKIAQGV